MSYVKNRFEPLLDLVEARIYFLYLCFFKIALVQQAAHERFSIHTSTQKSAFLPMIINLLYLPVRVIYVHNKTGPHCSMEPKLYHN